VLKFLVRLSNKVVCLDLAPFSKKLRTPDLYAKNAANNLQSYDNPSRVSFQLSLNFLCQAQILADLRSHPPRETGCDPALLAQLCWSSSSSFPRICNITSWNWTATKLNQLPRSIVSTTVRFLQRPGVLALICIFLAEY